MDRDLQLACELSTRDTLHPRRVRWLAWIDPLVLIVGVSAVMVGHGRDQTLSHPWQFDALAFGAMLWLSGSLLVRYVWSRTQRTYVREHRAQCLVALVWMIATLLAVIFAPKLPDWTGRPVSRWSGMVFVADLALLAQTVATLLAVVRGAAAERLNPGLVLTGSFVGLIAIGTALLLLPTARASTAGAAPQSAPLITAVFTATSAACVTGLIVEDTGTYWSREGQLIILGLIQVGGLGIMTFGAFFALAAGRQAQLREHVTLSQMMEAEGLGNLRRLVLTILAFTLTAELLGALLLSGLFAGEPLGERLFLSVFHAVSAYCNAGFALTENSFVGLAHRWQVWGVVTSLIVLGGLGFAVLYDLGHWCYHQVRRRFGREMLSGRSRVRLSLTSRIVLVTTAVLLVMGTVCLFLLERTSSGEVAAVPMSPVDAWFQSVTFRTAGFNTVDLGLMRPGTKLLALMLMFIGASPGSTGGGVKTVVAALASIGLISVLRGRQHLECFGRRIPDELVHRALVILSLSVVTIMGTTLLLLIYERQSDRMLPYLFEAVSAVGTVGVSSTIELADGARVAVTQTLSTPSRLVIIVAMFLGRVGPLTLLMALMSRQLEVRYQYPEERVTLG